MINDVHGSIGNYSSCFSSPNIYSLKLVPISKGGCDSKLIKLGKKRSDLNHQNFPHSIPTDANSDDSRPPVLLKSCYEKDE